MESQFFTFLWLVLTNKEQSNIMLTVYNKKGVKNYIKFIRRIFKNHIYLKRAKLKC